MRNSSSIHVAASGIILLFLWLGSIPLCIYMTFSHLLICGWTFRFFHVLAIVNSFSVNVQVHVSFLRKVLSVCMPKSGIPRSCGSSIFNFLRRILN